MSESALAAAKVRTDELEEQLKRKRADLADTRGVSATLARQVEWQGQMLKWCFDEAEVRTSELAAATAKAEGLEEELKTERAQIMILLRSDSRRAAIMSEQAAVIEGLRGMVARHAPPGLPKRSCRTLGPKPARDPIPWNLEPCSDLPNKFNWHRIVISIVAKRKIKMLSISIEDHAASAIRRRQAALRQAIQDLTSKSDDLKASTEDLRDLRGSIRAFKKVDSMAKDVKIIAAWGICPLLRDVSLFRAIAVTGITKRQNYVAALNIASDYEIANDRNYESQMLMAFQRNFGEEKYAFTSNSEYDADRRGHRRPRRGRGGNQHDDEQADISENGTTTSVSAVVDPPRGNALCVPPRLAVSSHFG
jgi:hypothetical protein